MIDLEERLRSTYRAVAERTQVASQLAPLDADLAPVVPLRRGDGESRRPGVRFLTIAAALVLLGVATTAVLSRRDTATIGSSTSMMEGRTRAIPGMVLAGFGLVDFGSNSQMGLPGFQSPPDGYAGSVLRYVGASGKEYIVTAASDPGVLPLASAEQAMLASGAVASVLHDPEIERITLAWVQTDTLVSIRADGVQLDDIVSIADSMWFTDPQTFDAAIEQAGFAQTGESWQPNGAPFGLELQGSVQTGLQIVANDLALTIAGRPMCVASSGGGRTVLLVGPGKTDFRIGTPTGSTRLVPGEIVPGMPSASVAIVELDSDPAAWPQSATPLTCTSEDQR